MTERASRAAAWAALILLVGACCCLRLIPAVAGGVELDYDAAFHLRMTSAVAVDGTVPSPDMLASPPVGRNVRAVLPVGLYYAAALFHFLLSMVSSPDLLRSVMLFCALTGAFVVVPVYLLARTLYGRRTIALACAALAGVIPAYLDRTLCYQFRYEIPAMPVLLFSLWSFVMALRSERAGRAGGWSLLAAVLLCVTSLLWRLHVVFAAAYAACFAWAMVARADLRRRWWVFLPVLVAPVAAWITAPAGPGGGMRMPAILELLLLRLGILDNMSKLGDFALVLSTVEEMQPARIGLLLGSSGMAWAWVFAAACPFLRVFAGRRDAARDTVAVFMLFFLVVTLAICRGAVFLSPLCALCFGEVALAAARVRSRVPRIALTLAAAVVLAQTAWAGVRLSAARGRDAHVQPSLSVLVREVRARTPANAVLLSSWQEGYALQTYAGRATATDGLLEDAENVRRIVQTSRLYMGEDEQGVSEYCRRLGVTHVVVSARRALVHAVEARVDGSRLFSGAGVTEEGKRTVYYRLVAAPATLRCFRELYRNGDYILFAVVETTACALPETILPSSASGDDR